MFKSKFLLRNCLVTIIIFYNLIQINYCQRSRFWGNSRNHHVRRWPFLYSTDPKDVVFYLYPNTENEDYREKIDILNNTSLYKSSYNSSRPVIILIHGLLASPSTVTDVINIKNAYLSVKYEANIIMVDHSKLQDARLPVFIPFLNTLMTFPAHWNAFRIGEKVGNFIKFLLDTKVLKTPEQVHLIGIHNGGYIAGHTGRTIANISPGHTKIGRISGLETPGGSIFPSLLDSSDATFVDISYTAYGFLGFLGRVGHVDFYINGGGIHQPNCRNGFPFTEPYCSHISSVYYFAKSIRNMNNMIGCKCTNDCRIGPTDCKDKIYYGQYASPSARGNYYVGVKNYE